jgi:hypothetical protein
MKQLWIFYFILVKLIEKEYYKKLLKKQINTIKRFIKMEKILGSKEKYPL